VSRKLVDRVRKEFEHAWRRAFTHVPTDSAYVVQPDQSVVVRVVIQNDAGARVAGTMHVAPEIPYGLLRRKCKLFTEAAKDQLLVNTKPETIQ